METRFELGQYAVDVDSEYVTIQSQSGNWEVAFRSDNPKYGLIISMLNDESAHEALEMQIVVWYHFTNCMPDEQLMIDWINDYERFGDRMCKLNE